MKTIGLLGGMSWHSSLEYYRLINEMIQDRLGGVHSARCLLYSVEFAEIDALERQNRWNETASILITAGPAPGTRWRGFYHHLQQYDAQSR